MRSKLGPTWALTRKPRVDSLSLPSLTRTCPPLSFSISSSSSPSRAAYPPTETRAPGFKVSPSAGIDAPIPSPASSLIVASPDNLNRAPVSRVRTPSAVRGVTPRRVSCLPDSIRPFPEPSKKARRVISTVVPWVAVKPSSSEEPAPKSSACLNPSSNSCPSVPCIHIGTAPGNSSRSSSIPSR